MKAMEGFTVQPDLSLRELNREQIRMQFIPYAIRTVILLALLIYAVISTLALTAGRKQVIEENYDTFSVISLSDYSYSSYKGILRAMRL